MISIIKVVIMIARRSNQSILKEISPECALERLMLKLKLENFGHLMQRADSFERSWCWERLKAGGEGNDRGWDGWMASRIQWTWVWANSRRWWTGKPGVLYVVHGVAKSQTRLSNWTVPEVAVGCSENSSAPVGGVCNFLSSVSLQQKFAVMDGPVLQLYVSAQFYLESKGKYILKAWGQTDPKDVKRREAPGSILAPLFTHLSPPLGPTLCKLA